MTKLQEEVSERLDSFFFAQMDCVDYDAHEEGVTVKGMSHDEAKKLAIKNVVSLIEAKQREARIDELEQILSKHFSKGSNYDAASYDWIVLTIQDRLSELRSKE